MRQTYVMQTSVALTSCLFIGSGSYRVYIFPPLKEMKGKLTVLVVVLCLVVAGVQAATSGTIGKLAPMRI